MDGLSERILLSLSRGADHAKHRQDDHPVPLERALELLKRVYPNLSELVSGKRVVDFGCGAGNQSIALAKQYGCTVLGVDSNPATLSGAIQNAKSHDLPEHQLSFVESISNEMQGKYDVVISQNSFEHFPDPAHILNEMNSLIHSDGIILITFGPPWFAPYGSHMQFFCKIPWVNILFSEKTVMKARSRYRSDGAQRYEEVESGLNRMSLAKFEAIIRNCNLKLVRQKYECVRGMNFLAHIPLIRELFVNHVTAVLARAS